MDHDHATPETLLDLARDRLPPAEKAEVERHVAGCEDCRRAVEVERGLDGLLDTALPRRAAPPSLVRRIEARLERQPRRGLVVVAGVAAGVIAIAAFLLVWSIRRDTTRVLLREAVNDHLRVIHAARPVEIESNEMQQIKPWFTGRLDFAPGLAFQGDAEFTLRGAAVGWFVDRKCAVYVFARGPHAITLVVMPAADLDWPRRSRARERGFETLLWREGDLAYGLVSDADAADLGKLAERLTPR